MSEPTAEPANSAEAWPEARPPHLPDRLTAVPSRGWLAVTAAGVCLFLSTIMLAVLDWVVVAPSDSVLLIVTVAGLIRIAASVLLLVALAIGLPSAAQLESVDAQDAVPDSPELR